MKRFDEANHQPLHWVQPRMLERVFKLQGDGAQVATLVFRSAFGSLAIARTSSGSWTFKRVGFWKTRATVRVEGQNTDVAVFEPNTWSGGGTLTMADGRSLRVTTNLWQSKVEFLRGDDDVLFRYDTEGFVRQEATLTIGHAALAMPELPWLVTFGWYLVVTMHEDASAAVVIIS